MSRRVLTLLALMAVVVAASFWWQSEKAAREHEALPLPANASPEEKLALTRESVDAIAAENTELASRVRDLEVQSEDAQKLIELKTARLQKLENPEAAQ